MDKENIMNKNNLKLTLVLSITILVLILSAITICKINIYGSQKNISGEIEKVILIPNPENDSIIKGYINSSVGENKYNFGDNYNSFSDAEKDMKFDLNEYNVYKVVATFQNNSNIPIVVTMNDCIESNQYIVIPSVIPYIEVVENSYESWEYYVFISKEYSQSDIDNYLKLQGVNFNIVFQKKHTGGTFIVNCKL